MERFFHKIGIAPTGSMSIIAGNASPGAAPVAARLAFLPGQQRALYKMAFELDERWIAEHAADRTPYICLDPSVNAFLAANV